MPHKSLQKLHPMHAFGVVPNLQTPFRVQRFEERFVPLVPFPHKHSFYHLVVVTAGRGWHEIDFRKYPIEKGRIFLMKPAQVHSWGVDKTCKGFVIEFEEELLSSNSAYGAKMTQILQSLPDSFVVKKKADLEHTQGLCESMLRDFAEHPRDADMSATLTLILLLIHFSRLENIELQDVQPRESFAAKFLNLVEQHYRAQHDVEFYAQQMNMTAKALTMKLHRLTGKSARALVQERLLLEGKRLLAYSDLSVSAIAENLGFQDANYFSRLFKIKILKTPLAFRHGAKRVNSKI